MNERESRVTINITLKDTRSSAPAMDVDPKNFGGVQDICSEDRAIESQPVMPWTTYVGRCFCSLFSALWGCSLFWEDLELQSVCFDGWNPEEVLTSSVSMKDENKGRLIQEACPPHMLCSWQPKATDIIRPGHFQVPYLEDLFTEVQMFESAEIVEYLKATYSLQM